MKNILRSALNDDKLSHGEKLLFQNVFNLSKSEGYCFATNGYLAKKLNVVSRTIGRYLSKLKSLGYITVKVIRDEFKMVVARHIFIHKDVHTPMDTDVQYNLLDKNKLTKTDEVVTDELTVDKLKEEFENETVDQAIKVAESRATHNVLQYAKAVLVDWKKKGIKKNKVSTKNKRIVRSEPKPQWFKEQQECVNYNNVDKSSGRDAKNSDEDVLKRMNDMNDFLKSLRN